MSNAVDFISAYNVIDARLRAVYRGKGNLQFADLVRRCAENSAVVKKYEEELISFARLRNAIVHESTKEKIIAQPCDEATQRIVHIAKLLSAPPQLKRLKEKGAKGVGAEATLGEAIVLVSRTGYSNLPVFRGGRMIGILNNRRLVYVLGEAIGREEDLNETLRRTCADVLLSEDMFVYYKILGREDTVQAAIDAFGENRKLLAVVVTEHGQIGDRITNILVPSDLPALLKLLEE